MRRAILAVLLALPLAVVAVSGRHHAAAAPSWNALDFTQAVIMGVSAVDSNNLYIAGGDNGVGPNAFRSTDGGNTFTNVPLHAGAMMEMAVAAVSPTSAIVAGLGLLGGGTQYTTNGQQFLNASEPKVSLQQTQDATIVVGADAFAVTGGYSFFGSNLTINGIGFSNDGGATFAFTDIGGDANLYPARYGAFPSTSVGFVSAGTWPPNKKSVAKKELTRNIHFHASGHVASVHFNLEKENNAAGWSAGIFRSTDGFQTFDLVYTNDTFYFNQISCASEQVCFAAAENDDYGYGFRTTDGGDTWEQILQVAGVSMMSCHAISEDEVWLGGGVIAYTGIVGKLYHSLDGGNTFAVDTLNNYYLTDLSFVASGVGYATAMNTEQTCNVLKYA